MYQTPARQVRGKAAATGAFLTAELLPPVIRFLPRIPENSLNDPITNLVFIVIEYQPFLRQTIPHVQKSPPITGWFAQIAEIKKLSLITHAEMQNSRSVTNGFFDYEDALSLRQMALVAGVGMPHYLLAPEVGQLLPYLLDLTQRLFGETLWNTGARLNECLALKPSDFVLENGTRPFVVIKTLKQRSRGRGRPEAGEQLRRIVPLFDEAYVHRLREYFRTFRPKKHEPIWNVKSDDTPRNWIKAAVQRAARDGVTFSLSGITPKTFRHSFAMHLIQNHVPMKVVQAYMGHTDAASTEIYTKVFALDVGYQRAVRFTVPVPQGGLLRNG